MGAVADAVGGVVGAVLDPIKEIGHIAESAVREVGHAVESVGREVGKVGQAAIDDPIGTIAKVAAVVTQQYWALPLIAAADVVAHGGNLGQAALAAGISYVAQGVAVGVGEALGSAGSGVSNMISQDAASMAEQGLSASQIAETLAQSYPEVAADVISQTADLANMGMSASQIASDLGATYGSNFAAEAMTPAMQNTLAGVAGNAAGAGSRTALSGGSLTDVLSSMGTAGLGTAVGAGASAGMQEAGLNSGVSKVLGTATGAATASAASGKDGKSAFINSLINTTLSQAGAQTKSFLKDAWGKVNSSVTEYNTQLDKLNQSQSALAPLEQQAKDAEAAVNNELAAYKPVRDKFSDLVKQYDDAKAAGNTALANSLADQANAMIPELNTATEKYNNVYNDYSSKLNSYSAAADQFKADIAKTDELKAGYTKNNAELAAETKKLSDAAAKVVTMSEPVQNAFAKMYQNGTSVEESLANSDKLNSMSTIAQEAFNRNIATNSDTNSSFAFADKINSLDTKQQSAFQSGITTGLDDNKALEIAPIISNFNSNQQQAYTGAIKQGYGQEGADLISAFASFAPEQTSTAPASPTQTDVASVFTKMSPEEQAKYKELVNDPSNPMAPTDALKAVSDFFISPAAAGTLPPVTKTPDGKDIVESIYKQDPTTGKWGEYVSDGKGGYTNTGAVLVGDYSAGPSGNKYVIDQTATDNGVPSMSMTPYTGAVSNATPTSSGSSPAYTKPMLDSALAAGEITKAEYDQYLSKAVNNTSSDQNINGGTSTNPAYVDNLLTPAKTGTGTGTTSTTVSNPGTSTTGSATTSGGPVSGGAAVTGGTGGTGTSAEGTGGTGTGTNGNGTGTGNGTGGTGTGTGTGGSGIGFGIGTIGGTIGTAGTGYAGWQALQNQDQYGGIKNLTPGLTERMDYTLSGLPTIQEAANPTNEVPRFSGGGSAATDITGQSSSGISGSLTPGLTKAQVQYLLSGMPGSNISVQGHAAGGEIEGHNPSFFSEGGLGSIDNRYVQGEGDGTSDSVAAMLANGEFVIPADVVSKIGNGSNEAGAGVLDQFLEEIRKHANSNGVKLPPESKGPLAYLLDAKRKVKA